MKNLIWETEVSLLRAAKNIRYSYRKDVLRYQADQPRVFGIGDSRTGTRSLSYALETLGFPTVHWPQAGQPPDEGWISWINDAPYQGFVDHPISDHNYFEELDHYFPDAKFVLTTREEESWKESVAEFFENTPVPNQRRQVNEWYKARRQHEKEAKKYFSEEQLAVIPLESDNKWARLCSLLDKDVPNEPYPHANKRSSLFNKIRDLYT